MSLLNPAWLNALSAGTYRGVPFTHSRVNGRFGRRVAIHEYTGRDDADAEDLGAKAAQFGMDLYVIGADYFAARDALMDALDAGGPGDLVNPYLGLIPNVLVLEYETDESTEEGGLCRFSVTFFRKSAAPLQTTSIATQQAVADQVTVVKSFQAPALQSVDVSRSINLSQAVLQLSALVAPLAVATTTLQSAIGQPSLLASALNALFDPITDLVDLLPYITRTTNAAATNPQSAANRGALVSAFQVAALIRGCSIVSMTDFDSADWAIATRNTLFDAMDGVLPGVDDDTFDALQDLRAAVNDDIVMRAAQLPNITTITLQQTLPALALAQRLYGSAAAIAAADDIVARNNIEHPGFLPSRVPLEVLSDWQ